MAKPKMTRLQQVLMVVAIAVIAVYFFLNKVQDPLTARLKTAVAEHNKVVQAINTLQQEPVTTAALQKSIERLTLELKEAEGQVRALAADALTLADKIEETVMAVSAVAANNGLLVQDLTPAAPDKLQLATEMQREIALLARSCYRMKLAGDFLDFIAFVRELETVPYRINLANLSITGSDSYGRVVAELVLVI
jgi:Tfp pilus assembly protein PilO